MNLLPLVLATAGSLAILYGLWMLYYHLSTKIKDIDDKTKGNVR